MYGKCNLCGTYDGLDPIKLPRRDIENKKVIWKPGEKTVWVCDKCYDEYLKHLEDLSEEEDDYDDRT